MIVGGHGWSIFDITDRTIRCNDYEYLIADFVIGRFYNTGEDVWKGIELL